jgi:N-acetylglucosaminyldiphosphoundecaprenol N-acetyl-beta-D-mannosaminyltransferase
MRWGGESNKNILSYLRSTVEIINSLNKNKIKKSYLAILLRIFFKYTQFKFDKITRSKLKRDFYFEGLNSVEKLKKINFTLIKKYNKLVNKNNSFVYAGLNLAFIGFYLNNKINNYQNLYLWPDGLFSKIFDRNIDKIPGRNIIKNLILNNKIKSIHIIGNLTNKNRKFLLEKFNKKIKHTQLPYSNINVIIKFLKVKTNLNELTLITLPTPKQEIIAEYIKNNNKSYKIICIGASLNIASGEEMETPIILQNLNLEFLWRLRTDTWRRIKRIYFTITYLVKDRMTINKFNKINIKIIN